MHFYFGGDLFGGRRYGLLFLMGGWVVGQEFVMLYDLVGWSCIIRCWFVIMVRW